MTKSKASQQFDTLLRSHVRPVMQEHGFRATARGRVFERWRGDIYNVISCNPSFRLGSFDMGTGIGSRAVMEVLKGCVHFTFKDPAHPVLVSTNVGYLRPPFQYKKWPLHEDMDVRTTAGEVIHEIVNYCLPFLDEFSSLDRILEEWEIYKRFYSSDEDEYARAAAWVVKGDFAKARLVAYQILEKEMAEYERLGPLHGRRQNYRVAMATRFHEYIEGLIRSNAQRQ